jgi:hypothetical protein
MTNISFKNLTQQTLDYLKYKMAADELTPADAVKLLGVLVNVKDEEPPDPTEPEPELNILLPIYNSAPIPASYTILKDDAHS